MGRTGVLLLGFGGPDSIEAVAPFMCNLMGREPSDELVERVCNRYLTIGGSSPLVGIANDIARGLEERLLTQGHAVSVRVGMRYWEPFIGDAISELKETGCDRIVTISLSPFESKVTSGSYREAIAEAVERVGGIEIVEAPLVSEMPEYVDFFASSTAGALQGLEPNDGAMVVFTAHSLPESDLVDDDPYVAGLEYVAQAVALKLGMSEGDRRGGEEILPGLETFGCAAPPRLWLLAFQSKGERPGAWLGPDLASVITVASQVGVPALVVVPIGFMTDHMETLYDLDVVAAEQALDSGLEWQRAGVPNDHASILDGLARIVTNSL